MDYRAIYELFDNFHKISELDIVLYDAYGKEQVVCRSCACICNLFEGVKNCSDKLLYSGKISEKLQSPYIFETPCGLVRSVCPVVIDGETVGYLSFGPVSLWDKDEFFVKEITDKCLSMSVDISKKNFNALTVKQIDCDSMTGSAKMLSVLVNYLVTEEKKYIVKKTELEKLQLERLKTSEELRLRESIKSYRKFPDQLEKELIAYMQLGEKQKATEIINNYLNQIFSYASGDLSVIKAKLYEFTAYLSRAAVEAGAPIHSLTDIIKKSTNIIIGEADYQDVCNITVEILNNYIEVVYKTRSEKPAGGYLAKAINYINMHYMDAISLQALADEVFVSNYYLSHLFRDELGTTFSDYLNKVRVENAKNCLIEGKSVEETCGLCGFSETNYFIKIFKKYAGITPSKYRKQFV